MDRNELARNYNIEVSIRTSFKQWLEGNDALSVHLRLDGGQRKHSNTTVDVEMEEGDAKDPSWWTAFVDYLEDEDDA